MHQQQCSKSLDIALKLLLFICHWLCLYFFKVVFVLNLYGLPMPSITSMIIVAELSAMNSLPNNNVSPTSSNDSIGKR